MPFTPDLPRRYLLFIALVATQVLEMWLVSTKAQPSDGAYSAERIRTAWEERCHRFDSFVFECAAEDRLAMGALNYIADPSSGASKKTNVPPHAVILHFTMTFAYSDGRLAYSESGEFWNIESNELYHPAWQVTFDGKENRMLGEESDPRLGELGVAAAPGDRVTCGKRQRALWLGFNPIEWLNRQGYQVGSMSVAENPCYVNGHQCVQLSIPRGGSKWELWIYADPVRDFVPLRFVSKYAGVLRSNTEIEYERDSDVGWRVSGWKTDDYDSGSIRDTCITRVTDARINETLPDRLFTIEFPKGTHVAEQSGNERKYFVVTSNGERQYINEMDYGSKMAPPVSSHTRVFWLCTVSMLAMLACLVFAIGRRRTRR